MSEILQNTGVTLWSIRDDYDELQTSVFEALTGTGGKSNIRLIDEAIGNINSKLNGYCFEYSDDRLYICKKNEDENIKRYPVTLDDNNGHIASKVDGSTITIDENGIVRGLPVDDALSSISTNPVQNKVVKAKVDEIEKNVSKNTEDISKNSTNISSNTQKITSLETAVSSEKTRAESAENQLKTELENGKKVWDDKYTKSEVDNKLSILETNIDWKEAVSTYDDIATTYPNPDDGWTVNVKDTDYTYRYNGTKWVTISANAIPKATNKVDGLMTKEYAEKLDGLTKYTPDGTTITADEDGMLHGVSKIDVDDALSDESTNPVQNKAVNKAIDELKKSVSDGKIKVANAITGKGVETATDATFDVMAENISKIDTELHGATLAVSTSDSELFWKTVTLTLSGNNVGTTVLANNGKCSFVVQNPGTYTITCGEAHKDATVTSDNVLNKTVISVNLSLLKIVTFADGTDEEIAKMIQAHYNRKIKISDYWAVGDTRTVSLSAMEATGVGESHRAQSVQFVIGDFDHDDLVASIQGHTKAAVTLLQKDCLMDATSASNSSNGSSDTERGYMHNSSTNTCGWMNCARRTWCNNVYFKALPTAWQSMIKTVKKQASIGDRSAAICTVKDKIFLAAECEIFGVVNNLKSASGEGTQYKYYKTSANRYKNPRYKSNYVTQNYWERSPCKENAYTFCCTSNASMGSSNANNENGLAPCMCI